MRFSFRSSLVIAGAMSLAACASHGVSNRDRPDEFAVQRQAPLVVPPDFSLVPPQPGAPRPAEGTAAQQALQALFGGPAPRSAVETSALNRAGTADPGIRSAVGSSSSPSTPSRTASSSRPSRQAPPIAPPRTCRSRCPSWVRCCGC